MSFRLLVVEDETSIRVGLEDCLRASGYEVESVGDGQTALQRASSGGIDAILLDLILPLKDGLDVCAELRSNGIETPVVMLTARTQLEDTLRGFAAGADDYLTKPFEVLELLARIRAIERRSRQRAAEKAAPIIAFGTILVDTVRASVWRTSERVRLSTTEYALLHYFVTHPGETLSRERLLREVWKSEMETSTRTVDMYVAYVRKKIGDDPTNPRWIRTVYGQGYEFVPD